MTLDYQRTRLDLPPKIPAALDAFAHHLAGLYRRRAGALRALQRQAGRIDRQAPHWQSLSDRLLRDRLTEFRAIFRRGARRDDDLPVEDALAAVREATARQTGLRPFPVQLISALALRQGWLAEMATGEGKTLTAAMAAVLFGWTQRPCHVITVNDYLAQRDAEWFAPLYRFCGVTFGFVTGEMEPRLRQLAYAHDVTYTTSKEITADFLRDRLRLGLVPESSRRLIRQLLRPRQPFEEGLVLRGLDTAIVDEADSVLIDEAVTPLIISSPRPNAPLHQAAVLANRVAGQLERGRDYRVDLQYREIQLQDAAEEAIAQACAELPGFWRSPARRRELVQQALTARELFLQGQHYVLQEGKVVIVDEFTGRMMRQRTWRYGLHQAIEAKEGLAISPPSETLARISFQRFFRLFRLLCGMTGTAREATREFWQVYRLPVLAIPTNKPCQRQSWPDRLFPDQATKWDAIILEIQRLHQGGRPILVGTRSVNASEYLAGRLQALDLRFRLLNAVHHREEAQIVAEAGQLGTITIATNMAGRGTDIKLGRGTLERGGLHVLATERHESGRIDRQLYGRSARQGDPGSAQAFISLEDELPRKFLSAAVRRRLEPMLRRRAPTADALAGLAFNRCQGAAERQSFRQRRNVLALDTHLDNALAFAGPSAY